MLRFFIFLTVFNFFLGYCTAEDCMDGLLQCPELEHLCDESNIRSECQFTCGVCTPDPNVCADRNPDCPTFSFMCFSYKNLCPKTCGVCKSSDNSTVPVTTVVPVTVIPVTVPPKATVPTDCVDQLPLCPYFFKPCDDDIKQKCPVSCGVCEGSSVQTKVNPKATVPLKTTTVIPKHTVPPTTTLKTTVTTKKPTTTTPKPPCKDSSPNCPAWAKNGFCTNTFYPPEKREEYCAKTCNFC